MRGEGSPKGNSDGNTNVRFHQKDTLRRFFERIEQNGIRIKRASIDCGSCSRQIVETVEKHSEHFYIRANNCSSLYDCLQALRGWQREVVEFYNLRGGKERIFDDMNNGFGWARPPKSTRAIGTR